MKRYVCTVATGLLLAFASTGTATAGLLPGSGQPELGQAVEQATSFGDQSVGEQRNDADVSQEQGNGNVNIAPAIAVFGDAETSNSQGSGNEANADVDQSNSVEQAQTSNQTQTLDESGSSSCCDGQSQTADQRTEGGEQSVDKQVNEADVSQAQGNGNVNIAPAVAIFGDADTSSSQGNDNVARTDVEQSNHASQTQTSNQQQEVSSDGGESCCEPEWSSNGCCEKPSCCEDGQSQAAEQDASFGDQRVDKQANRTEVTQNQGNENWNVAPAFSLGKGKNGSCNTCGGTWYPTGGDATTRNSQGNGNEANADVDQGNSVEQTQTSTQRQPVIERCKGLVYR